MPAAAELRRVICVAVFAAALAGLAGPAHAGLDCPQPRGIYQDGEAGHELRFGDKPAGPATATNVFTIRLAGGDTLLEGVVLWNEGVARPTGIVMKNCPEGDVTGDELAACTLWEGVIYTVADDGTVGLLTQDETQAAPRLLLADFGRAVSTSDFLRANPETAIPWDAFDLTGCAR